jgi:ABC-2 type transport system ATP-binding protein
MTESSGNVIEVRDLHRHFRRTVALDGVDLSVPRGGVFGLVGENGAGKTTLIKHLMGLLRAQQGSVRVFGMDPVADPEGVLGRIGYLSEDRDLPGWMRVEELMRYTSAFYPKWDLDYAEELRDAFELEPKAKLKTLSRGQLAKAGLLSALAHKPDLLLLDEPSSGLDVVVRRDILGAIIRTVADEGRTVLFSSHLLDEVERVADEVAMIYDGKVALSASMAAIRDSHHRVVVRGEDKNSPVLPNTLWSRQSGREWTLICHGSREEVEGGARSNGWEVVEVSSPSLEDVFIARASHAKSAREV